MLKNPLVSIIIPSYNRAGLLEHTLNSIIKQTYANWECIIVDDHSTDDTFLVASRISEKDARIKVYKRPSSKPKGPSSCRNYGFEMSSGAYVNWFDSDDLMVEDKLELDLKKITSGDFDFTISQSQFFDDLSDEKLGYWNDCLFSENVIEDFVLKNIGWSVNTPLWRKASLEKFKLQFHENLMTSDDYFYHIQALEKGLKPIVINEVLTNLRVHENRLENFKYKSPFKRIVYVYLLKNASELKLSTKTLDFLNNRSIKVLSNLYKHKEINEAMTFSLELLKTSKSNLSLMRLFKLYVFGLIFYVSNRGYNYIE